MATFLITGAGRGIGRSLADKALAGGHRVYGSVRGRAEADALGRTLGPSFHPLVFDVTDHAAMHAAVAGIDRPLDILINNAGTMGPSSGDQTATHMDFAGFAETLAVNTIAPLAVTQAVLPLMGKSERPAIVSISSQMSFMGQAKSDHLAYRTSKVALNKVMQGLATDLVSKGVPVLIIDPGWVRTDMGGHSADLDPDEVAAGILDLALSANMAMSGRFWMWNGKERQF